MGYDTGIKSIDLMPQINNSNYYDLFQIMRCIEQAYFQADVLDSELQQCPLHLHAATELSFPSADIRSIQVDENGYLNLSLNFLGLCGVDSPLPQYWLEKSSQGDEMPQASDAFLEIFQQRLYVLLYFSWKKYLPVVLLEQNKKNYLNYLQALSGQLLNLSNDHEFAYAGLLGQRIHNAETLAHLLMDYLEGTPVEVMQFVPKWLWINHRNYLTHQTENGIRLNDNALLGLRVMTLSDYILISLGPMPLGNAYDLLLDRKNRSKLWHFIKLYVGFIVQVEIVLKVIIDQISCLLLGTGQIYLGWGSVLGKTNNKLIHINIPYELS